MRTVTVMDLHEFPLNEKARMASLETVMKAQVKLSRLTEKLIREAEKMFQMTATDRLRKTWERKRKMRGVHE